MPTAPTPGPPHSLCTCFARARSQSVTGAVLSVASAANSFATHAGIIDFNPYPKRRLAPGFAEHRRQHRGVSLVGQPPRERRHLRADAGHLGHHDDPRTGSDAEQRVGAALRGEHETIEAFEWVGHGGRRYPHSPPTVRVEPLSSVGWRRWRTARSRRSPSTPSPTSCSASPISGRPSSPPTTSSRWSRGRSATSGRFPTASCTPSRPVSPPPATSTRKSRPSGRRRRLYRITPRGRKALQAWLAEPIGDGTEVRDLGLLKLFFAAAGSPDTVTRLAEEQRAVHEQNLAGYDALHEAICGTAGELGARHPRSRAPVRADGGRLLGRRHPPAQGKAPQGRAAPMRPRR